MLLSSVKHQGADAVSQLPSDEEDKTELNDASPVLTIVLADKPKKAEENDEKRRIGNVALNKISPGLSDVSTDVTTPTPFIEPRTAKLLAEKSKDPLCRQFASNIGTSGSDYSYICNGFQILVAPYLWCDTESGSKIATSTHSTHVPLSLISWAPCGTKHVRHHATQSILISHGQRRIHKCK